MKKAFAYIRVSGTSQTEGTGLDRQEDNIRAFAASAGYKIAQVFREEAVSGTTDGFDRPALNELAASVEKGIVVLVESSDRLARDLMVQEVILDQFRDHKVPMLDASGVDLTNIQNDPTRTLIRQVLGAVAEFNKSQLVGRLKAGRDRVRAKTGRCEGQKPYADQRIIELILHKKKQGVSVRKIAEELNHGGYPSPKNGRQWYPTAVQRIIAKHS